MGTFNLLPVFYVAIASLALGATCFMVPFGYGHLPVDDIVEVHLLKEGDPQPCVKVAVEIDYDRDSRSVTLKVEGRVIRNGEVLIDWLRRLRIPNVTVTVDAASSLPWEYIVHLLRELEDRGYRRIVLLPRSGH